MQFQITELSDTLPKTIENARAELSQNPAGKKIVDKLSPPESLKKGQAVADRFFQTTFGAFGDIYAVLFLGIFCSISKSI
jgi:hypothetical protein